MSDLMEHRRLGIPLGQPLPGQPPEQPPVITVTTAELRMLALAMLAEVEKEARERAECRAITPDRLAEMMTKAEHVQGLMRACKTVGDIKAAGVIHSSLVATQAQVLGYAHRAATSPMARCEED